jgi:hypothetical protein
MGKKDKIDRKGSKNKSIGKVQPSMRLDTSGLSVYSDVSRVVYTSGDSEYDNTRMDYKTLLPAEKAEHLKELWRICYMKSIGAAAILKVFSLLHSRVIEFGTTKNIHINREILSKRIIEKRSKIILLPDDPFKRVWNVLVILLLIYVATYVPYDICFGESSDTWNNKEIFDFTVDMLFLTDIFVNFISSYDDD